MGDSNAKTMYDSVVFSSYLIHHYNKVTIHARYAGVVFHCVRQGCAAMQHCGAKCTRLVHGTQLHVPAV